MWDNWLHSFQGKCKSWVSTVLSGESVFFFISYIFHKHMLELCRDPVPFICTCREQVKATANRGNIHLREWRASGTYSSHNICGSNVCWSIAPALTGELYTAWILCLWLLSTWRETGRTQANDKMGSGAEDKLTSECFKDIWHLHFQWINMCPFTLNY